MSVFWSSSEKVRNSIFFHPDIFCFLSSASTDADQPRDLYFLHFGLKLEVQVVLAWLSLGRYVRYCKTFFTTR